MNKQVSKFSYIAVVIPAYRESRNLALLLPRIIRTLPGVLIIIVDDSDSIEGSKTSEAIKKLQYKRVSLIKREGKKGRGSAVLAGLTYALRMSDIQYVIEMDADLAHAPEECIRLLRAAPQYDMVIGSRYLRGSKINDWPMQRLIQSKIINFVLYYWLGLHITDYTNGFRLYSRSVVEFLMGAQLKETGFIALSEIAYKIQKKGFVIGEVPISFSDRQFGKSNADIRELIQSLIGVIRIRLS